MINSLYSATPTTPTIIHIIKVQKTSFGKTLYALNIDPILIYFFYSYNIIHKYAIMGDNKYEIPNHLKSINVLKKSPKPHIGKIPIT